VTPSGIKHTTIKIVVKCLNQLHHQQRAPYLVRTSAICLRIQKFIKIKLGELQTTNCAERCRVWRMKGKKNDKLTGQERAGEKGGQQIEI
jgi:hypothetical protein